MTAHCSHCGSQDIAVKGDLRWNVKYQAWEIVAIQNSATCNKCKWREVVEFRTGEICTHKQLTSSLIQ
jgi:hypothetical protein